MARPPFCHRFPAALLALGAMLLVTLAPGPARAADPPVIHDIQPREAKFREWVTITGTGFGTSGGRVTFAGPTGRLGATTRDWSDTRIRAEVPYNTVPGDVFVRTAAGLSSNGFRFSLPCWDRPEIHKIVPPAARRCDVVKIQGCGFGDFKYRQELTFNGFDASGRLVGNWGEEEFLVRVPDEATSGPVVITNPRSVPSSGHPFNVLDDTPDWPAITGLATNAHGLDFTVEVGVTPDDGGDPYQTTVSASHDTCIGCPSQSLPVTWHSATHFTQVLEDGPREWHIEGWIDPDIDFLHVTLDDKWQTNPWHNSSTNEEQICRHHLRLTTALPISTFNIWGPRYYFRETGAELGRRTSEIEYEQYCDIYEGAELVRRDGVYEFIEGGWENASFWFDFNGEGRDPCRNPNPSWEPTGQIHGQVYAALPVARGYDIEILGERSAPFTGFPASWVRVTLPGVPVRLLHHPVGGAESELAATVADENGRYVFQKVPLKDDLRLEAALEHRGVSPPGFHVTYNRAVGVQPNPVTMRGHPFSNVDAPLMTRDLRFDGRSGQSSVPAQHIDDVAHTYAHTWQAWQAAGELGLTLDLHAAEGKPLEIRTFSPEAETFWKGPQMVGPTNGLWKWPVNVHINIEASEAETGHADRPSNREWHEMGHHVQADIQGNSNPTYDNLDPVPAQRINDDNHFGRLNPSSTDSWVEGFAEFFSALVGRRVALDQQPGLYRSAGGAVNLDVNYTSFGHFAGSPKAYEEFAVASLLWDLVDTAGDEHDLRPMGVSRDLLNAWGFQFTSGVPDDRLPMKLYGDRIHIDERSLLFIVANADKIGRAYGIRSVDAPPDYDWIFDVDQLYGVLKATGIGQFAGSHGLTALDELFVAHGFFEDTSPQNLFYDPGEVIGRTDNDEYTTTGTTNTYLVEARAPRYSPPPIPEAYLDLDSRDAVTGRPVETDGYDVEVTFAPPYEHYNHRYAGRPTGEGRLYLHAPDPVYDSTLRIEPRGEGLETDAPLVMTGEEYWRAVTRSSGPDLRSHTFDVRQAPDRKYLPIGLYRARRSQMAGGRSLPPPTRAPTDALADDLVARINGERDRMGLTRLAENGALTDAARWFAADMARDDTFRRDHVDSQGRPVPGRLVDFGYGREGHVRWQVAENVAAGQNTAAEVLADWLDSPPHRANLWDAGLCEVGVAVAHAPGASGSSYWVADLGCRTARATMPPLTPEPGEPTPTVTPTTPPPTVTSGPTTATPTPTVTTGPTSGTPRVTPRPTPTLVAGHGIQGRVTDRGTAAEEEFLTLVHHDGTTATEVRLGRTFEDGRYGLATADSLAPGEQYYVRFSNDEDTEQVGVWFGPSITSYTAGQDVHGGDFDLADVPLTAPEHGASVALPAQFEWQPRGLGAYTYRWVLYDETSGQRWTTDDLGNTGSVTLNALPDGAIYDHDYYWYVRIYDGPESYGLPFYMRGVRFAQGTSPTPEWQTLYEDDFCDDLSGWPVGESTRSVFGYELDAGCTYHVEFKEAQQGEFSSPGQNLTGDFAIRVPAYPILQGTYGIMFGMTPARDLAYIYVIDTWGRYGLFRNEGGTWTPLVPYTDLDLVDPGFGNELKVESRGTALGLFVDDNLINTVDDGRGHGGLFGVYAESAEIGFDAHFVNYRIDGPRPAGVVPARGGTWRPGMLRTGTIIERAAATVLTKEPGAP